MYWFFNVLLIVFAANSWGFDPMAPPGYDLLDVDGVNKKEASSIKKSVQAEYVLQQIVIKDVSRSAVINGYVVNEGSYLKKARVKKINSNTVILDVSGKEKTLTLESRLPKVRR